MKTTIKGKILFRKKDIRIIQYIIQIHTNNSEQ